MNAVDDARDDEDGERTPKGEVLLEAHDLSRTFGGASVVQGVQLKVARGDIVGFVGKNGAGKTTTLRMLAGVLAPSTGTVKRTGAVGYAPETPQLDPDLTVKEQLLLAAALCGLKGKSAEREVGRVMAATDVGSSAAKLTCTLSKGTKQRVGLAQALLGSPPILLLDEPGAGLDPTQLAALRVLLSTLAPDHAIFVSTHHVADIVETCTRVIALARGRVVLDQDRGELGLDPERVIVRVLVDEPGAPA